METFFIKGQEVQATMSLSAALGILSAMPRKSTFVQSLLDQHSRYARLSYAQQGWVHKIANESAAPSRAVTLDLARITDLFATARAAGLKKPGIKLQTPGGEKIAVRINPRGNLNVSNGGRWGEDNVFYGAIEADGHFAPRSGCPDAVIQFLQAFADHPAEIAAAYGHHTGNCSFCNQGLSDSRSLAVGYGPICAAKWGLPWGEETPPAPRGRTRTAEWLNAEGKVIHSYEAPAFGLEREANPTSATPAVSPTFAADANDGADGTLDSNNLPNRPLRRSSRQNECEEERMENTVGVALENAREREAFMRDAEGWWIE